MQSAIYGSFFNPLEDRHHELLAKSWLNFVIRYRVLGFVFGRDDRKRVWQSRRPGTSAPNAELRMASFCHQLVFDVHASVDECRLRGISQTRSL